MMFSTALHPYLNSMRTLLLLLLLAVVTGTTFSQLSTNREGKFDREYGSNGLAQVRPNYWVYLGDSIMLPSGETLHGYDYYSLTRKAVWVVKMRSDGSRETEWGVQGMAEIDIIESGTFSVTVTSLAGQSDGGLLVAGIINKNSDYDGFLLRLTPGGKHDTSFGESGFLRFNFSPGPEIHSDDWVGKILIDPQGRIVVVTLVDHFPQSGLGTELCILSRLHPNGTLDTSFGANGHSSQVLGARYHGLILSEFVDARFRGDGKIVVGATFQRSGSNVYYSTALGYLENGDVDSSFGTAGRFDVEPAAIFNSIHVQRDGKIVLLHGSGLTRLNQGGSVDSAFGYDGTVALSALGRKTLVETADNKLIVCGTQWLPGSNKAVAKIFRYWPDGTRDARFGVGGQTTIESDGDFEMKLLGLRENKYLLASVLRSDQPYSARLFATRKP